MEQSVYSQNIIVTPDMCDQNTALSLTGILTAFQTLSAVHTELLGIGVKNMAAQKKFWVTVHNQIQIGSPAWLLQELQAETWAEPADPESPHCFRSYALRKGETIIALGRTKWAILGPEGERIPFRESGFPANYAFSERGAALPDPSWMEDDLTEEDLCERYRVRSTDIDFGRHMNNILYVRRLLDQFPARAIVTANLKSLEIHYGYSCKEGEPVSVYSRKEKDACRMSIRNAQGRTSVMASLAFVKLP